MALRLIESITHTKTGRLAKVYRDAEWNEYRVKFYQDGKHQPEADYHTDDLSDAQGTARHLWTKTEAVTA